MNLQVDIIMEEKSIIKSQFFFDLTSGFSLVWDQPPNPKYSVGPWLNVLPYYMKNQDNQMSFMINIEVERDYFMREVFLSCCKKLPY